VAPLLWIYALQCWYLSNTSGPQKQPPPRKMQDVHNISHPTIAQSTFLKAEKPWIDFQKLRCSEEYVERQHRYIAVLSSTG
jgi:hypothetical protein